MKPITYSCCRQLLLYAILIGSSITTRAQDTLRLSLREAEAIFFKQNLALLAADCRVEAEAAREIQAKLYPNPVLSATFNVRDPENNKWLHVGRNGQNTVAIEQLIVLGGKRKAALALAAANTTVARANLETLVRNLLHELRQAALELTSAQQYLSLYTSQLAQLKLLADQVKVQVDKNNLPMKDLVRIRSTYMQLDDQRNEVLTRMNEKLITIRLLLASDSPVLVDPGVFESQQLLHPVNIDSLYRLALEGRPEMRMSHTAITAGKANLEAEKKEAIPDLTASANYDRFSGAFRNEFNAGVSMPLPLFNRNQGNIRSAKAQLKEAEYGLAEQKQALLREVDQAYVNWLNRKAAWERIQDFPRDGFSEMLESATGNYRKGNLGLIEFMDLYESATEAFEATVNVQLQLHLAAEELNYRTAAALFLQNEK